MTSQGPSEYDAAGAADPEDVIFDPDDEAERDDASPDLDAALGIGSADAVMDPQASPYDTSWVPPDRPLKSLDHGLTLSEMRAGESLDRRLAEEEPDVFDSDRDVDSDAADPDHTAFDEPDPRAGRLVEDDEGAHEDTEKDLVANDVGIAGGGASAEEAAVHIVDEPPGAADD